MTSTHEEFDGWSAAYVLSALEPDEKALFEAHMAGCSICQGEVNDFAVLPGMLAQVDRAANDDVAHAAITQAAIDQARDEVVDLRRSQRRWRQTAIAAIAAAFFLIVGIGVVALSPEDRPDADEVAFESSADGVVLIDEQPWGTRIELDLIGLDSRPAYRLWTVDDAGDWQSVVAWNSPSEGIAKVAGGTLLEPGQIARLVITAADNVDDIVLDALLA